MSVLSGLSLKVRLLVGSLVWISLTLLVTGFLLSSLFRSHVERRFDAELATHLDQLLANLTPDNDAASHQLCLLDERRSLIAHRQHSGRICDDRERRLELMGQVPSLGPSAFEHLGVVG